MATLADQSGLQAPAGRVSRAGLVSVALSKWSVALVLLGLLLFVPAGTFVYWQAWCYFAILGTCSLAFIAFYLKVDPELIRRRMELHEKEREQRNVVKLSLPLFVAAFVIPGLDQRFGWSNVPTGVVVVADGVVLLGYLLFARVMQQNPYASRVIAVEQEQPVITTGLYATVRHPMYVAVLMIYLVSPIALGSYWGLTASVWFIPILAARIRNEEKVLRKELKGYEEYCSVTRYRLIPGVW
jgi:protein-S-isoprenylcysteine O-methyltransferase Ste14